MQYTITPAWSMTFENLQEEMLMLILRRDRGRGEDYPALEELRFQEGSWRL